MLKPEKGNCGVSFNDFHLNFRLSTSMQHRYTASIHFIRQASCPVWQHAVEKIPYALAAAFESSPYIYIYILAQRTDSHMS